MALLINVPSSIHTRRSRSVYVGQEVIVIRKYMDREAEVSDKSLTWTRIMRRAPVVIEVLTQGDAGGSDRASEVQMNM
jgi:hypothetical protein